MSLPPPEPPSSQPGLNGVPVIDQSINLSTLSKSKLEDKVREAKDKYTEYFPEGLPPSVHTNRSMILLAKNVTDELFDQRFLPIKARYLRDENLDLYIRKVPGNCHGALHARVGHACVNWVDTQGLQGSISVKDAAKGNYHGKKCEPDVGICAVSNGLDALPRCIIEIEISNRTTRESRELAALYFTSPEVGAVVLLKVWKRRQDGTFAAACIVWVRPDDDDNDDDDGDGARFGSISSHEFGSAEMTARARRNLAGYYDDAIMPWPYVPEGAIYTRPNRLVPVRGRQVQNVTIPAYPIIVNATTLDGVPLLNINPAIQDLEMNLSKLAFEVDLTLPAYAHAAVADDDDEEEDEDDDDDDDDEEEEDEDGDDDDDEEEDEDDDDDDDEDGNDGEEEEDEDGEGKDGEEEEDKDGEDEDEDEENEDGDTAEGKDGEDEDGNGKTWHSTQEQGNQKKQRRGQPGQVHFGAGETAIQTEDKEDLVV